jgi:hypothetical protein
MQEGKCIHYNGSVNECCEAGVNYGELAGGKDPGWGLKLPCIKKFAGPSPVTCDKRQEPTPEQLAEWKAEMNRSMERIGKARKAIVDHLGGPWKRGMTGSSGSIPCPNCAGTLQFSRAGYNGHIHARCSSEDCVAWME